MSLLLLFAGTGGGIIVIKSDGDTTSYVYFTDKRSAVEWQDKRSAVEWQDKRSKAS